jgi:hypothetical protein
VRSYFCNSGERIPERLKEKFIMRLFSYYKDEEGFWFRFGLRGPGLSFRNRNYEMLFSERNGYRKSLKLPYGWRVLWLPRRKY